jgi:hypothetical protein
MIRNTKPERTSNTQSCIQKPVSDWKLPEAVRGEIPNLRKSTWQSDTEATLRIFEIISRISTLAKSFQAVDPAICEKHVSLELGLQGESKCGESARPWSWLIDLTLRLKQSTQVSNKYMKLMNTHFKK